MDKLGSVVGLVGSPRKNGRTAYLIRYALKLLKSVGFQTKEVNFGDVKITPCGICCDYVCSHRPIRCPVNDDVPKIYDLFRSADLVVISCPVYGGLLPAIMYAFKERAQALAGNWPLTDKDVVLLLNCSWGCERPMHDLERHFGVKSRVVGKAIIPNPHSKEKVSQLSDNERDKVKKTLSLYLKR